MLLQAKGDYLPPHRPFPRGSASPRRGQGDPSLCSEEGRALRGAGDPPAVGSPRRAPWGTAVSSTAPGAAQPENTPRSSPGSIWVLKPHLSPWEHRASPKSSRPIPLGRLYGPSTSTFALVLKCAQRCEDRAALQLEAAGTVHPFQSRAHVPDGLCQLPQGFVQGLLVALRDGANGLDGCL